MHHDPLTQPALTVALALAAGIFVQSLARHLRIPGIVLLLATGVILGPDLLDIIRPEVLGDTLQTLVGFAVAVILFEGGMNLNLRRLRRQARSIRQLVTLGAVVTAVGGALAARWILGWEWRLAVLFGSLVIVTGPTVINPLLRRIRVHPRVATVLEAEGVLVDAIGAIIAVVILQVALEPRDVALAAAAWDVGARLGFGLLAGLVGGLLIASLLRVEHLVPEGLENVFTLAFALALFQGSNALLGDSGIVTVTIAGLVVGNVKTRALGDLREFKEQLTILLVGMLFVLLAADVRVAEVMSLGVPGLLTVLALMFVVRPLNILVGTHGSDLSRREKAFLAWMAPRGIVAAAVASLFAQTLTAQGIPGGGDLRAMVFLVIGATVLVQGLSGGIVASALGLRRPSNTGYAILGANDLGRALGHILRGAGQEVVLLDSNPDACAAAEREGFRVLFGSGLKESILLRAEVDSRAGCVGVTSNDEVNLMFARTARREYRVPKAWVALRSGHESVTEKMVHEAGSQVLFGIQRHIDFWMARLERGIGALERWTVAATDEPPEEHAEPHPKELLPLAVERGRRTFLFDQETSLKKGDTLFVVIFEEQRERAEAWLRARGWHREQPADELETIES